MSNIKITALIENKAPEGLRSEHGLSLLIEYGGGTWLLDTGASDAFASNAVKLGADLSKVDVSVLSHAHYDHSGGYGAFFAANGRAKVYLRSESKNCYIKLGPVRKYIGMPKGMLEKYSDRFEFVSEDRELAEGVRLIGHSTPGLAERGRRAHLYRETPEGVVPDDFVHEQSLVFDTPEGLVILNSCCHGGADNIVAEVKKALPGRGVAAIVGGFHLMGVRGVSSLGVKPGEVEELGRRLLEMGVKHAYTCHCTGDPAFKILERVMGENVSYLSTGKIIEL